LKRSQSRFYYAARNAVNTDLGYFDMRILVISDTHGEVDKARDVIESSGKIDLVIHLGDYFRDAQKLEEFFPDIPFEYIYGNSDFMIGDTPSEKLLEYKGKRIFITHGHKYSVKWDYEKLYGKAKDMKADILLFGHTHVADIIEREGYTIVNPGSISDSRDGEGESYAIIDLDDKKIKPEIVYV